MAESNAKPSRISRLTQPRKSTMNAQKHEKRSLSEEQRQTLPKRIAQSPVHFTAPPKRSRSAMATPLKTPMRTPVGGGGGGAGRTPRQTLLNTGGELADRQYLMEKAARIIYILQTKSPFGHDFLGGGLKTITQKQFAQIMEFFAQKITGNRLKLSHTNTPDEMLKFFENIQYPYIITKSTLKTINAPHSFPIIVELLSWMCDFIDDGGDGRSCADDAFDCEENLIDPDGLFPDQQYIHLFKSNLRENFNLWNNKEEKEYNENKGQLIDQFIAKRLNGVVNATKEKLITKTMAIQKEYNELYAKRIILPNEQDAIELNEMVERIKVNCNHLLTICNENVTKIQNQIEMDRNKRQEVEQLQMDLMQLKEQIRTQTWTVDDRQRAADDLYYTNEMIKSERTERDRIKDAEFTYQMQIAQLLKQQIGNASKLNAQLNQIQKSIKTINISSIQSLDAIDSFDANAKHIEKQLNHLLTHNAKCKSIVQSELRDVANVIKQNRHQLEQLKQQQQELHETMSRLETQHYEYDHKIASGQQNIMAKITDAKQTLQMRLMENEEKSMELLECTKQCDFGRQRNQATLELMRQQCKMKLNKQRLELTDQNRNIELLRDSVNQLRSKLESLCGNELYTSNETE